MTWPDTTGLLADYLHGLLDVPVTTRVPRSRPDWFVQLRLVGGSAVIPVRDEVRVDVHAWAPTDPAARELALTIRSHVWAIAGTDRLGPMCYRVEEFMGPRMLDDDQTGTPRAWTTYALWVRADDAIHFAP